MSKKSSLEIVPSLCEFEENFKKLGCFDFVDFIFKKNYKFEDKKEKDFKREGLIFLFSQKINKRELERIIHKFVPHDPLIAGFGLIFCACIDASPNFKLTTLFWNQIRESRREKSRKKDRLDFQKLVLEESDFLFSTLKNNQSGIVREINFVDFLKKTAYLRENYKINQVGTKKDSKQKHSFYGGFDKRGISKNPVIVRKMNFKKAFKHGFQKTACN